MSMHSNATSKSVSWPHLAGPPCIHALYSIHVEYVQCILGRVSGGWIFTDLFLCYVAAD